MDKDFAFNKSDAVGKFDVTDRKLIFFLCRNSRLPLNQLAKLVGKSKDAVRYRISNLLSLGVIRGFRVIMDPVIVGHQFYQVFFRFQNISLKKEKEILNYLKNISCANQLWKTSGEWDVFLLLDVRDPLYFNEIVMRIRNKFSPYINDYLYNLEVKEYRFKPIADAFFEGIEIKPLKYKVSDSSFEKEFEAMGHLTEFSYGKIIELSEKELEILLSLDDDVRQPIALLSEKVSLAKDTVKKTIRELIEKKCLGAFWPWLDIGKLGFEWFVVFLRLKNLTKEREQELECYFKNHPNILRAVKLIGNCDVLISFNVKNLSELHVQVKDLRLKFSDIILRVDSLLLEEELKFNVVKAFASSESGRKEFVRKEFQRKT